MSEDNPYMSQLSNELQAQLKDTDKKLVSTIRQKLLDEAKVIVSKDRNSTYGEPEDNFATIAELWKTYLLRRFAPLPHLELEPHDVAAMCILIKMARIANDPTTWDNWVDTAGYAAGGAECVHKSRASGSSRDTVIVNNKPLEIAGNPERKWNDL